MLGKLAAQRNVIVDFTVTNQPGASLAPHRLLSTPNVYDRQPAVREAGPANLVASVAVRSAMSQELRHTFDDGAIR
jgi:hypothetical protein